MNDQNQTPPPSSFIANEPGQEMTSLGNATVTPEQNREMYSWLVEDGKLSRAQADAELKASGLQPLAPPAPPKNEFSQIHDKYFSPAKSPGDYSLPNFFDHGEEPTPETAATDRAVRSALVAGEFGKESGESFVNLLKQDARAFKSLDKLGQEKWLNDQKVQLINLLGEKTFEEKNRKVQNFLSTVEKSESARGISNLLANSPMSSVALNALFFHVENLERRHGRKY